MTLEQAIFLAILQGISELFPVSSLGHAVLVPALLHWTIKRDDPTYLAFLVVLHLGTGLALMAFYWSTWAKLGVAFWRAVVRGRISNDPDEHLAWLLIAGTVPIGILGVFLEQPVRVFLGSTILVACFLVLNGLVLFLGNALRRRVRVSEQAIPQLSLGEGALIGAAQGFSLLPGVSRSGCAMVAGLLRGLSHEEAARFAFLLATPVIFAAAVLEIPKLCAPGVHLALVNACVGGVVAAVTGYLTVAFLTRYFQANDLRPFAWYCVLLGAVTIVLTLMKVVV